MEEDYKKYSKKTEKKLDDLGINYVWRDSCLDILIEMRKCMKLDLVAYFPYLDQFSICRGIQKLWKECEYNRESILLDKYFETFEKKSKELLEDKGDTDNNESKKRI